jgi:hypothetical protein
MDSCQAISVLFNGGWAPGIEPGNLLCERMTVRQLRLKIKDPTGTLALEKVKQICKRGEQVFLCQYNCQ